MTQDIDYLLTGLISGTYTEVTGKGQIDQSKGTMDLELTVSHAPDGWDPGIILLICCQNLRLYSAILNSVPSLETLRDSIRTLRFGNEVNSQRYGFIKGPDGRYVVGMKAKGFLFVQNQKLESLTVVLGGFSELNKYKGIKHVPPTIKFIFLTFSRLFAVLQH